MHDVLICLLTHSVTYLFKYFDMVEDGPQGIPAQCLGFTIQCINPWVMMLQNVSLDDTKSQLYYSVEDSIELQVSN